MRTRISVLRLSFLPCRFLLLIYLGTVGLSYCVNGQDPAAEIIEQLRQRQPEPALQMLAELLDQSITARDICYSGLPSAAG